MEQGLSDPAARADPHQAGEQPRGRQPLAEGTKLLYNRGRTGELIPQIKVGILEPGYYYTVGEDLTGEQAAQLVALGTLRLYEPKADRSADASASSGAASIHLPTVL